MIEQSHKNQQLSSIEELPQEHSNLSSMDKQLESNQNSSSDCNEQEMQFEESKEPKLQPKIQPQEKDSRKKLDELLGFLDQNSDPSDSNLLDSRGSQNSNKSWSMGW